MTTELMGGYIAYTSAPDIIAEAAAGAVGPDEASTSSITLPLTVTVGTSTATVTYFE